MRATGFVGPHSKYAWRMDSAASSKSQIDVIIVAYNSGTWLSRAVLAALAANGVTRVIVVDNASVDQSLAALPDSHKLIVIRLPSNVGFSAGCNRGAMASDAEFLLFLNPDCLLGPQDVRMLSEAFAPDVGVVSAQLLNADGSLQAASLRRDPTPRRAICESIGLRRWGIHVPPPALPGLVEVEACSGALMVLPREVFDRLDGFDEGYFLHCEDLDLCRRVRALGLRVLVNTAVRVTHDKGTSSLGVSALVAHAKYRGMLRYFEKFDAAHTPFWLRWAVYAGAWFRYRLSG